MMMLFSFVVGGTLLLSRAPLLLSEEKLPRPALNVESVVLLHHEQPPAQLLNGHLLYI
jgi:hypothetical protein